MSKPAMAKGKSLQEFRSLHDKSFIVPEKIKAGIATLGPEGWEYEVPFMRIAELSTTDLAMFRQEFEDFIVTVGGKNPKRCWCGSKELAKKLKAMV